MSAMSASPVKPVLPPAGVSVPPPVATSPQKGGIMPIPATLTIAPTKPANMNHTVMPLSLIADHKIAPQFPTQAHTVNPPSMQPLPQPIQRTPEKTKELSAPLATPTKPTSNGMEGLVSPSQPPSQSSSATPFFTESQISAPAAPLHKLEPAAIIESQENNPQTQPENLAEPPVAASAPPVANEVEKKDDAAIVKPVEPLTESSIAVTPETDTTTSTTASMPAASAPTLAPTVAPTTAQTPATAQSVVPSEQQLQPSVTPSVSRTETSLPHSKPELKVATIPRQAAKRKREPKITPVVTEVKKEGKDEDRKSKRVRLPTQPYQSPLPELNIIAKINKSSKSTPTKAADDKLIVFYKNEFLAVRNAEGGFYVCQAMQNIYRSSPRIRIRWLSQEEGKDTYSPDFYDHTDFDCILTNLNLDRVEKEKFRLPEIEQQRTESILKRALDVEKGVSEKPPVTEEHPDGLDLSLFRDESQLKKTSKNRSKSLTGKQLDSEKLESDESNDEEEEVVSDDEEEKKAKKESAPKTSKRKKKSAKKKPPLPSNKRAAAKTPSIGSKSSIQPEKKKTEIKVGSKRKSSVSPNTHPVEKRARKSETSSQSSDRTNKTRSVEGLVGAKSQRDRRAKNRK